MRVNYQGLDFKYDPKTNTYSRVIPKLVLICPHGITRDYHQDLCECYSCRCDRKSEEEDA